MVELVKTYKQIKEMFIELDKLINQRNNYELQLDRLNSMTIKSPNIENNLGGYSDKTIVDMIDAKDKAKQGIADVDLKIFKIETAISILNEIEVKVMKALYSTKKQPIKQLEYSKELNISKSTIYRTKDEALKKLFNYFKNN